MPQLLVCTDKEYPFFCRPPRALMCLPSLCLLQVAYVILQACLNILHMLASTSYRRLQEACLILLLGNDINAKPSARPKDSSGARVDVEPVKSTRAISSSHSSISLFYFAQT